MRSVVTLLATGWLSAAMAAGIESLSPSVRLEYDVIQQEHQDALAKVNQRLATLGENFTAALRKRREAAQASGELENVLAAEAAIKSFAGGTKPSGESSDPAVAKVEEVYLTEHARISKELAIPQAEVWRKHRISLDGFVTRLTKAGEIDAALIVRKDFVLIDRTVALLTGKEPPLIEEIAGSRWLNTHDKAVLTFRDDGKATGSWGRTMDWKHDGGDTIIITFDHDEKWVLSKRRQVMTNPGKVKWTRIVE